MSYSPPSCGSLFESFGPYWIVALREPLLRVGTMKINSLPLSLSLSRLSLCLSLFLSQNFNCQYEEDPFGVLSSTFQLFMLQLYGLCLRSPMVAITTVSASLSQLELDPFAVLSLHFQLFLLNFMNLVCMLYSCFHVCLSLNAS